MPGLGLRIDTTRLDLTYRSRYKTHLPGEAARLCCTPAPPSYLHSASLLPAADAAPAHAPRPSTPPPTPPPTHTRKHPPHPPSRRSPRRLRAPDPGLHQRRPPPLHPQRRAGGGLAKVHPRAQGARCRKRVQSSAPPGGLPACLPAARAACPDPIPARPPSPPSARRRRLRRGACSLSSTPMAAAARWARTTWQQNTGFGGATWPATMNDQSGAGTLRSHHHAPARPFCASSRPSVQLLRTCCPTHLILSHPCSCCSLSPPPTPPCPALALLPSACVHTHCGSPVLSHCRSLQPGVAACVTREGGGGVRAAQRQRLLRIACWRHGCRGAARWLRLSSWWGRQGERALRPHGGHMSSNAICSLRHFVNLLV